MELHARSSGITSSLFISHRFCENKEVGMTVCVSYFARVGRNRRLERTKLV